MRGASFSLLPPFPIAPCPPEVVGTPIHIKLFIGIWEQAGGSWEQAGVSRSKLGGWRELGVSWSKGSKVGGWRELGAGWS